MGVDAEELILRPFREVVERGNDAVTNAEATAAAVPQECMLKASRAVVREGERALRKIQPIWDGQVEKYGDTFKETMMDQDDMDKGRRLLEDLLYDFEDYAEPDTFDVDKYTEVQAATKSFALDVINIIKRLKLEGPRPLQTVPSFPPLPPLPPGVKGVRSSIPPSLSRSSTKATNDSRPRPVSPIPASPTLAASDDEQPLVLGVTRSRKGSIRRSNISTEPAAAPKRTMTKSSTNSSLLEAYAAPLDDGSKPPPSAGSVANEHDDAVSYTTSGASQPMPHDGAAAALPRTSSWVRNQIGHPRPRPLLRTRASRDTFATDHSGPPDSPKLSRYNSLTLESSSRSVSLFDSSTTASNTPITPGTRTPDTRMSFMSNANSVTSFAPSTKGSPVAVPDVPDLPDLPRLPEPTGPRLSPFPRPTEIPTSAPRSVPRTTLPPPPPPTKPSASPVEPPGQSAQDFIRFEPVAEMPPVTLPELSLPSAAVSTTGSDFAESKLAMVDEVATISETASTWTAPSSRQYSRETDCSIGPASTFRQMQGFCKGAESFRIGGHWQGIKQVTGYVANRQSSIGRCVSCGYGHNYEEIELDINKKSEATFNQCGARFRVRLLYKSHVSNSLVNQRQAESFYACLFCVQAGCTAREGDATIFTTSDALLLHIARHQQPLPPVPGLTVLYGAAVAPTDPHANDFDLHLPNPPLPTPLPDAVLKTAVATATKEHRNRYGQKKLPLPDSYGGELLEFLAGARIIGVTFPEKWSGKWCLGWHDGRAGAFPAKVADVEPPRQSEIPMESSSSGMSVTTRWKWHPRGEGDADAKGSVWLEFEKGEVISNVRCLYADHWCWSGTNSKGRTGVFPQSHVLLDTLRQESASTKGRRKTDASGKSRGLFGRRPGSSSNASSLSVGMSGRVSALS